MAFSQDRKPCVPPGWIACWDDKKEKWYYGKFVPVTQWEAPSGTFFPPESDIPLHEQTENGANESLEQDSLRGSSQKEDENITLQKHQKPSEIEKSESSSSIAMEVEGSQASSRWMNAVKVLSKFCGFWALSFLGPFLVIGFFALFSQYIKLMTRFVKYMTDMKV